MIFIRLKQPRLRLAASEYDELRQQVLIEMDGGVNGVARSETLKFITNSSQPFGDDSEQNLITLCNRCHRQVHGNKMSSVWHADL